MDSLSRFGIWKTPHKIFCANDLRRKGVRCSMISESRIWEAFFPNRLWWSTLRHYPLEERVTLEACPLLLFVPLLRACSIHPEAMQKHCFGLLEKVGWQWWLRDGSYTHEDSSSILMPALLTKGEQGQTNLLLFGRWRQDCYMFLKRIIQTHAMAVWRILFHPLHKLYPWTSLGVATLESCSLATVWSGVFGLCDPIWEGWEKHCKLASYPIPPDFDLRVTASPAFYGLLEHCRLGHWVASSGFLQRFSCQPYNCCSAMLSCVHISRAANLDVYPSCLRRVSWNLAAPVSEALVPSSEEWASLTRALALVATASFPCLC